MHTPAATCHTTHHTYPFACIPSFQFVARFTHTPFIPFLPFILFCHHHPTPHGVFDFPIPYLYFCILFCLDVWDSINQSDKADTYMACRCTHCTCHHCAPLTARTFSPGGDGTETVERQQANWALETNRHCLSHLSSSSIIYHPLSLPPLLSLAFSLLFPLLSSLHDSSSLGWRTWMVIFVFAHSAHYLGPSPHCSACLPFLPLPLPQ